MMTVAHRSSMRTVWCCFQNVSLILHVGPCLNRLSLLDFHSVDNDRGRLGTKDKENYNSFHCGKKTERTNESDCDCRDLCSSFRGRMERFFLLLSSVPSPHDAGWMHPSSHRISLFMGRDDRPGVHDCRTGSDVCPSSFEDFEEKDQRDPTGSSHPCSFSVPQPSSGTETRR